MAELQHDTDHAVNRSIRPRHSTITGTSVRKPYETERPCLQPRPVVLDEPFDAVGQRRVAIDSTFSFEDRSYSVQFRYAGQVVEVRRCAESVQVWTEGEVIASYPRHTRSRILFRPAHYHGSSTDRVLALAPLGPMEQKLQRLWAMAPAPGSSTQYAALM